MEIQDVIARMEAEYKRVETGDNSYNVGFLDAIEYLKRLHGLENNYCPRAAQGTDE